MTVVDAAPRVSTLVELVQARASRLIDKPCVRFLADGENEQDCLTYAQLNQRACAFASRLASIAAVGDRAVLVYPPGGDFLVAFFGCVYAGVIAVPVAPPLDGATATRLAGVVTDSRPSCVLADAALGEMLRAAADGAQPPVLTLDDNAAAAATDWQPERVDPGRIAMLQYTSGSTRVPRGVMVTHANLLSNLNWLKAGMRLPEEPTIVSWLPAYHDMGLIGSLFQTIYNGGDCVLMSPLDFLAKPFRWLKAISDYHAIGSGSPPFGYELAARKVTPAERATLDLRDWKVACVTAEPIRAAGLERFADTFSECGFVREAFYPCYGLAETTLMVAGAEARTAPQELRVRESALQRGTAVTAADRDCDSISLVSCGTARPGERVAIVDPDTAAERDHGQVGEIWVNGPNVTRGYWGRVDETRSVFQARLHDGSGPFLRTGDLGFVRDGQLYVTGRLKDVLIIRGRNLYPHDIEWAAQTADRRLRPGCGAAFTVGDPDDPSIVLVNEISDQNSATEVAATACRSASETCGHAVRVVLIPARTIPKTSSGKVQHSRCRAMYLANELPIIWSSDGGVPTRTPDAVDDGIVDTKHTAPRQAQPILAELRRLVANAVAQRCDLLDIDAPLNRLGLDSLRALEIKETLALSTGIEMSLRDFLGESSVRELALRLAGRVGEDDAETAAAREPDTADAEFGLTDLQQAYCAGRSPDFELGNVGAHVYMEFEGHGLDTDRMESGWRRVIERHDALRIVVSSTGTQRVESDCPPWHLPVQDLRERNRDEVALLLEASQDQMSHRVFPLGTWPMFDVRVHRLGDQRYRVQLSADLLTIDAASVLLLVDEWGRLYRDPDAELPPDAGYRQPIEARAASKDSQQYRRALSYWRERAPRLPYAPRLPMWRNRDPHDDRESGSNSAEFVRHSGSLSRDGWDSFTALAARAGLTPSTALLAAYAEVLATWAEDPRFTVSVTMRQGPTGIGGDTLVGPFSDFILAGIDWSSPGSFAQHAQRLRDQLFDDLDHRDIGGVRSLREFARGKAISPADAKAPVVFTPVLRDLSVFDWLGEPVGGVSQTPQVCVDNQSFLRDGALAFHWDAVDDMFAPGVIDDMFTAYQQLLDRLSVDEAAWNQTDQFDLVPTRQQRIRAAVNATAAPLPELRLEDLFARQCQSDPDRVAVICAGRSLTYRDVNDRSSALAWWLQAQGTRRGDLVAVVTEKGWEQTVAVLAILMCGAAYVPLPPDVPASRLAALVSDSGATLVLTQARLHAATSWPGRVRVVAVDALDLAAMPAALSPSTTSSHDLCCVLYTSGSTGAPKGVRVHHRGIVNAILDTNNTFGVGAGDRALAITDLQHDMSAYDIFGLLAAGGAVVVVPSRHRRDPAAWMDLMTQHQITIWNSVPASMQMLLERAEAVDTGLPESLRLVLLGGDWIPIDVPDRIRRRAPKAEVVSVGGPTETTLWNIRYRIGEVAAGLTSIPYGQPIANTHYYVLDDALRDRPDWVSGELCSAGVGTSSGYWRDPALTAAKFVRHPRTGQIICRTGDFGQWLPDGNIEFVGRRDGQVQIDGRRVEVREIEAVLSQHAQVQSCVVTCDPQRHGRQRLIAHVVPADRSIANASNLDAYLCGQLPVHMRPGQIRFIESIPLTSNGKADRRALATEHAAPATPRRSAGDDGATAQSVASIVATVLGRGMVPLDSNLEDLGVGSLEMVRIAGALEEAFGSRPDIEQLFTLSSIGALAELFERPSAPTDSPLGGPPTTRAGHDESQAARYTIISDPQARQEFRAQRRGLRADLGGHCHVDSLPSTGPSHQPLQRRSTRDFAQHATTKAALAELLSVLRDLDAGGQVRRHAYGSGGGTYSVQTYLHVKRERVDDLAGGVYYYDPGAHALVSVSPDADELTEGLHWWWNRDTVKQSAFSVFLVAQLDAVGPLYGDRAVHFATIETGLMTQLLEMAAPASGLGLCQIGDMNFSKVRDLFSLNDGHVLLHSMVGGPTATSRAEDEHAIEVSVSMSGEDLEDRLSEPGSTVNVAELRRKAHLDPAIQSGPPSANSAQPQPVLLTGATGFLGGFVLRELLVRGEQVVCLVRAAEPEAARERLQRTADRLGIGWPAADDRIRVTPGDVSRPRLGLPQGDFDDLGASIGSIYHCAAPVSWVRSYASLEPAVVGGAVEMLRLATRNGVKPLHYVSSLAVFPFDGEAKREDHRILDHGEDLLGGYAQAKWVGERVMTEAVTRGLPVTIYRPPLISGHSRTGVFNTDSYFERMIKGCIELGEAPTLGGVVDVAPVDYVAAALSCIASQPDSAGRVYHLNNPHPMAFEEFVGWMRMRGYEVGTVPFAGWQQHLLGSITSSGNALHPLAAHLSHTSSVTMTTAPHDCRGAVAALASSGLSCPPVADELLCVYFEAFENSGYLGPGIGIGTSRRLA